MRSLGLLTLLLLAMPARGSVVRALDLPDLCRFADVVVHGVVADARSGWEGKRIVTRVTVKVVDALKGAPGAQVVVKRLGGSVGGLTMAVAGEATLAPGDEVVLFLERKPDGFVMLGMAQGVYRVTVDAKTGERYARQHLEGLGLATPGAAGGKPTEPGPRPAVPLAELLRQVSKLVR